MNNKKIISIILIILLIMIPCFIKIFDKTTKDEKRFKREYEELNNKYLRVNIQKNNKIKYITSTKSLEMIKSKDKSGIIFYGNKIDEKSRSIITTLIDVSKNYEDVKNIYYVETTKIPAELEYQSDLVIPTVLAFSKGKILGLRSEKEDNKNKLEKSYKVLFDKVTQMICYNGDDSC